MAGGATVALAVLLAPLVLLAAHALEAGNQGDSLLDNMAFQYFWIVLFFCAVPVVLVLLIRVVTDKRKRRADGAGPV